MARTKTAGRKRRLLLAVAMLGLVGGGVAGGAASRLDEGKAATKVLRFGLSADSVSGGFDPAKIQDHSTFEEPMQLASGIRDVFVNGSQVLKDGKHTGAKPGRVVHGPGWTGWPDGGACK